MILSLSNWIAKGSAGGVTIMAQLLRATHVGTRLGGHDERYAKTTSSLEWVQLPIRRSTRICLWAPSMARDEGGLSLA
jgi:hypothetical protein